jgi:hypothetical protein
MLDRTKLFVVLAGALAAGSVALIRLASSQRPTYDNVLGKQQLPTAGPGPCWTIEEKWLVLHPLCERAGGVAFPIEKHFDIRRTYDSSVGEDVNDIVESVDDRAWPERGFIRVDFTRGTKRQP